MPTSVFTIILTVVFISYRLAHNIRTPLIDLTNAANRFQNGDLSVRSTYQSHNEFGILANSFNSLTSSVQFNLRLSELVSNVTGALLVENKPDAFFRHMLAAILENTDSQMAAIYLLSDDKTSFHYFDAVGSREPAKTSFAANGSEGEFGRAIVTRKITVLSGIASNSIRTFATTAGEILPQGVITIPILNGSTVVAIISVASVKEISPITEKLVYQIWPILNARINGVLAIKRNLVISENLEMQNKELEQQSKEMLMQADELKEYNLELELQKKQLNEANQLKSAFLSSMSHELRTPLNSVIALSGVLNRRLKNKVSDDEHSYIGVIERNGKQLLTLINDILDLSKIEAGKVELSISSFPIVELVQSITESLQPIADEKKLAMKTHIQPNIAPIFSDIQKLRQVLLNVIGNAVKFTEKGSVAVEVEENDGNLMISVSDTGIGITQEELPFIFDEFRQVDGRTSRKYGGTGLGLAIARKYTQLLGGRIEVTSQLGEGSVFSVNIPANLSNKSGVILQSALSEVPEIIIDQSLPELIGKTLLLVEDSEPQIIQLQEILTEVGCRFLVARNGKEALNIIAQTIPDAMILDLMMPEVDGFEVLRSVREQKQTSRVPALILTAKHISKEELSFLKSNHVYQLIQKGDINRTDLMKHISNMLMPEPVKNLPPELPAPAIKKPKKATILLVEDNEDNTTTVKALINGNHYLHTAADGVLGLEQAKAILPDLILLDISLPSMDGFEVLKRLKSDGQLRQIPVIALTARAMKGDREDLLRHGFDGYISKPIDAELFEKAIQEKL